MDGEEIDNSKDTTDSKTNKKKSETKMENTEVHTDLTAQQNEDNYWHTTKETKLDGSTLMMETRIAKCIEATGKSREECSKEVKKRMKKAGSENTNTEDMTEDAQEKAGEEKAEEKVEVEAEADKETEKTEKKDTLEVTKERFDFLEAYYQENKEKESTFNARLDSLESTIKKYQEQESAKLDTELEERILKFTTDFVVPEEEVIKKLDGKKGKEGLKYVQDLEDILSMASVKPVDNKSDGTFDTTDYLAKAQEQAQKVRAQLRHVD
jgi:hypothetical protein